MDEIDRRTKDPQFVDQIIRRGLRAAQLSEPLSEQDAAAKAIVALMEPANTRFPTPRRYLKRATLGNLIRNYFNTYGDAA